MGRPDAVVGGGRAAALAAVVQAYASTTPLVEPYVSIAPTGPARVEAAATSTPSPAVVSPVPTPTAAVAAPTATPTPAPTRTPHPPTPKAEPTAPLPPTAAPVIRDRLRSADGTLNTGVTTYSDCRGTTPLTHTEAAVDTCVHSVTYFVGHNPGVFTPLMSENVGALITWWDDGGTAHHLRVVAVRSWQRADGVPPVVDGAVVAQFQTCQVLDGSIDRVLDAVNA